MFLRSTKRCRQAAMQSGARSTMVSCSARPARNAVRRPCPGPISRIVCAGINSAMRCAIRPGARAFRRPPRCGPFLAVAAPIVVGPGLEILLEISHWRHVSRVPPVSAVSLVPSFSSLFNVSSLVATIKAQLLWPVSFRLQNTFRSIMFSIPCPCKSCIPLHHSCSLDKQEIFLSHPCIPGRSPSLFPCRVHT